MASADDEFRAIYGYASEEELLDRLDGVIDDGELISLANGSMSRVYNAALRHGLITEQEYKTAYLLSGDLWHYAGD